MNKLQKYAFKKTFPSFFPKMVELAKCNSTVARPRRCPIIHEPTDIPATEKAAIALRIA
ncbi:MAG: hypothetical protein JJU37_05385 [Balneolaceae bacterium]|nr:hypothetical protein [Balneolaceae bacterium]